MTQPTPSLAEFFGQPSVQAAPPQGNTPWAGRYAGELAGVLRHRAEQAPRSLQRRLGPSEIGHDCDRQVVGKLAGLPRTNHVTDPWPSVVGTAVHAWLADAFAADNTTRTPRWLPERRVQPWPGAEGTADLYDATERAVVDHKALGNTTRESLVRHGPPVHYRRQLLMYGLGYRRAGLPVDRVVIAVWPRTKSSLAHMYVWDHVLTPADDVELTEVFARHAQRVTVAQQVREGQVDIRAVPMTPDSEVCYFCPFYRPQAAQDSRIVGCPGTTIGN